MICVFVICFYTLFLVFFFFFKQKTAYEMRISDWSSDVCSSDLLDVLVLATDIRRAENALLKAGWEWVKSDPYDDHYYRAHMHELPPMIHKARDRMIDVHHTILPKPHRITPDALALVSDPVDTGSGFRVLSQQAMLRSEERRGGKE